MKILGICCSPRQGQSTFKAMRVCLDAAKEAARRIEVHLIELAGKKVGPCTACGICKQGLICGWKDDFSELITALSDPQVGGIHRHARLLRWHDRPVQGVPRPLRDVPSQRLAAAGQSRRRAGCGRGSQRLTLQSVRAAMLCHDMICVSDGKDSAHFGAALFSGGEGGIEQDQAGLTTAQNLGRRVAELAVRIHDST